MKIVHFDVTCEAAQEADVEISDGIYSIIVFCHPCDYKVGQVVDEYLHPLFEENLQISDSDGPKIEKMVGVPHGYKIYATVLDYKMPLYV